MSNSTAHAKTSSDRLRIVGTAALALVVALFNLGMSCITFDRFYLLQVLAALAGVLLLAGGIYSELSGLHCNHLLSVEGAAATGSLSLLALVSLAHDLLAPASHTPLILLLIFIGIPAVSVAICAAHIWIVFGIRRRVRGSTFARHSNTW